MKYLFSFALATMAAVVTPAYAETKDYGTVAGFDIVGEVGTPTSPGSCLMTTEYEGPGDTNLSISTYQMDDSIESADTRIGFIITNSNWTSVKGQQYPDITMEVNGFEYSGTMVGMKLSSQMGFGRIYEMDILNDIAAGKNIRLYRNEKLFESLNLDGSGAAIQTFRRCMAARSTEMANARRERDRFKHLDLDPFAK